MYNICMSTFVSSLPKSLRIGVLRGGPSSEYENSIQTGQNVLQHLRETHNPQDIFISKDGTWHVQGIARSPDRILNHIDVIFNALHGEFGEDGKVQEILNRHGARYTGSDKFSSVVAMNKWITKERAILAGIKTPLAFVVRQDDVLFEKAKQVFDSIPHPLVVKPVTGRSSKSIYIVNSFRELLSALENVLSQYPSALVEEYITGKQFSCVAVDDFRGHDTYAFPPVDNDSSRISREEIQITENVSKKIHNLINLSHYSQSDFIVSPRRGVYFLEVNTLPNISEKSLVSRSLESVGVSMKEFLHHVISLPLQKK